MSNSTNRARHLRRNLTPPEQVLWLRLRNRALFGLKFRRQAPIGPYVADFLCERHHLVVELDGDTHAFSKQYDQKRDAYLNQLGYRVLRFSNVEVSQNIDGVLMMIARACGK